MNLIKSKYIIFFFPFISFLFPDFKIDSSFLANAIVFISIFFGFTSSSFAMIIFSNYAKSAYAKNNEQSNMFYAISDMYKKIFIFQITTILISLCYIPFAQLFPKYIFPYIELLFKLNLSEFFIENFINFCDYIYLNILCFNVYYFFRLRQLCENFSVLTIRNL